MKLPSLPHSRSRQHTASVMLLLWLFALASGVANACMLEQPASHAPSAAAAHAEPSKVPCLKACDDGSQALLKQSQPAAPCDPGAAPLVAILWVAASPEARLVRGLADPPSPPPPAPVRILYSRLTS